MKKLLLLALMGGMISGVAFSQEQKDMKKEDWDKKVKTELSLTEEQTVKYDAICAEYDGKIEAIKKDASLTKEAQKEKKMELKKEKQAKLFEFLTPEQQTKYTELMEKKKAEKAKGY